MKNKFTNRALIGGLAILTSVAPLFSGTAQAKHEERHDNGKHLGWNKGKHEDKGKHLGWDKGKHKGWAKKTVVQSRRYDWRPGRYRTTAQNIAMKRHPGRYRQNYGKWNTRRPRVNWNAGRTRRSNNTLNHRQTTNRIGQLLDTNYYSSRSSAQAAANRSKRNGKTVTVGYDAPGRRWVERIYNR